MHFARSEWHSLSPGSCIPRLGFARRTLPAFANVGSPPSTAYYVIYRLRLGCSSMDRLHIDANIRASTGKEASSALGRRERRCSHRRKWRHRASGRGSLASGSGVRAAALVRGRAATADDHNYLNYLDFAGYQVLTGLRFERVIELGCGPFTNLRYIARRCDISTVELLDPLIGDYLQHRNRYFDEHALYAAPLWGRYNAVHKRAPWIWRALASRAGRSVPISRASPRGA